MNRQELINAVSEQTGVSRVQLGKILDALLQTIKEAVAHGDVVQWLGFGSFKSVDRAARDGRNPKTGAVLKISASRVVKFIPGKAFKDLVNDIRVKAK